MIFPVALKGEEFLIERPDTHGGNQTYASFEDLEKEFAAEKVQSFNKCLFQCVAPPPFPSYLLIPLYLYLLL